MWQQCIALEKTAYSFYLNLRSDIIFNWQLWIAFLTGYVCTHFAIDETNAVRIVLSHK